MTVLALQPIARILPFERARFLIKLKDRKCELWNAYRFGTCTILCVVGELRPAAVRQLAQKRKLNGSRVFELRSLFTVSDCGCVLV